MLWIRLYSDYPTNKKTRRLVRKFGEVAERFPIRLWLWAAENSEDGRLGDLTAEDVQDICGHDGDPHELWDAFVDCGLLVESEDGTFEIKSWDEHQGKLIQHKRRQAERAKRYRERREAPAKPEPVAPVEPAPKLKELPLPVELAGSEEFVSQWSDWLKYKSERKESYKPTGYRKVLEALAARGAVEATEALRLAMSKGWQGPAARDAIERERRANPGAMRKPAPKEPDAWRTALLSTLRDEGKTHRSQPEELLERIVIAVMREAKNEQDARARVDAILNEEAA